MPKRRWRRMDPSFFREQGKPVPAPPSPSLADLRPGTSAEVTALAFGEADSVRLMELGFIPGTVVTCERRVPLGDLTVYRLEGNKIALRKETATCIEIRPHDSPRGPDHGSHD